MVADSLSTLLRASFNAPSVDRVDLLGHKRAADDGIVIRAHDDFDPSVVLKTGVALMQADSGAIESGAAVALRLCSGQAKPADGRRWVYTAGATVPTCTTGARVLACLVVTAGDRPDGAAQAEQEKAV
jgi:hypothetical protein